MKNFLKSLKLALVGVLLTASVAHAASTTVFSPTNGTTQVVAPGSSGGITLLSLVLANTNVATDVQLTIFDAPGLAITNIVGAYSNIVVTTGTFTNSWTNYFGVINSNVYTAQYETTNSVPSVTNTYPIAYAIRAPSNSVTTVNLSYRFLSGILVTNKAPVGITAIYNQ